MKKFTALLMAAAIFISSISIPVFNINPATVKADEAWPKGPNIVATAACMIEASTGTILYEKKPHKKMYPASITKILTALVTIENSELNEDVTFSEDAINSIISGDANMEMQVGEVLPVEDCLYGLMLQSANEVAFGLAEHVSGSVDEFANLMNERAKKAGALDSHFANPSGLHDPDHYITAYDMAMITRAAVQNPIFLSISGTSDYTVSASNKKEARTIYHRHKMLLKNSGFYYEGVLGGKTGYTDQSGTTLVTYAKKNGMTLITVVLNSNLYNAYNDTAALFDYGFENFNLVNIKNNDTRFSENTDNYADKLTPVFGSANNASLELKSDDCVVLPKNAAFTDVSSVVNFDFSEDDDSDDTLGTKVAEIDYTYLDKAIGKASVLYRTDNSSSQSVTANTKVTAKEDTTTEVKNDKKETKKLNIKISKSMIKTIIIAIAIIAVIVIIIFFIRKKQKELNEIRAQKRRRRY